MNLIRTYIPSTQANVCKQPYNGTNSVIKTLRCCLAACSNKYSTSHENSQSALAALVPVVSFVPARRSCGQNARYLLGGCGRGSGHAHRDAGKPIRSH